MYIISDNAACLSLANSPLDVRVSEAVCDGVPNADTVALDQQVVVHHFLDVAIETPSNL